MVQVFGTSYKEAVETDSGYLLHCLFIQVKDERVCTLFASFVYSLRKGELWYHCQELGDLQSAKSDTVEVCPRLG